MASQLTVTNEALDMIGEPPVSDTAAAVEAARRMAAVYLDSVRIVLVQAEWNFARVRVQLVQTATAPNWGYTYYYALPADWERIIAISANGLPNDTLTDYQLEEGLLACDSDTVYLYYITNGVLSTPGVWPPMFCKWVAAEMARAVAPRLNPAAIDHVEKKCSLWQRMSKNSDQVNQPPKLRRPGRWATACRTGFATNREQS
jgi:hypothetical protein